MIIRLLRAIEGRLMARRRERPVFDVNGTGDRGMRALFVYRTLPFHLRKNHYAFRHHQSLAQARWIAEELGAAGYRVDVVDIKDRGFRPDEPYDLVLNHRIDAAGLERAIGPRTLKIYLSSGTNHRIRNARVRERLDEVERRRGVRLSARVWDIEDMPWVKEANALVGFGNGAVMETWREDFPGPLYAFENHGVFAETEYPRNFESARREFLFLGSGQQVPKGLDLLLEVFPKHPEVNLHVCSRFRDEADFCAAYRRELYETPNVHAHGWVDVGGRMFQRLLTRCAFAILPSCSEGSPGSMTNAGSAGLIPILPPQVGIDLPEGGIRMTACSVEAVEEAVKKAASLPAEAVRDRSESVRAAARERWTEVAFRARWRTILEELKSRFAWSLA